MDRLTAEEIANSGELRRVTYNGKLVYIQNVDENTDTARIYYLDEPQNEFEVPLAHLQEK